MLAGEAGCLSLCSSFIVECSGSKVAGVCFSDTVKSGWLYVGSMEVAGSGDVVLSLASLLYTAR